MTLFLLAPARTPAGSNCPPDPSAAATHPFRRRRCCATVCRSYVSAQEEADFMMRAREFALK